MAVFDREQTRIKKRSECMAVFGFEVGDANCIWLGQARYKLKM